MREDHSRGSVVVPAVGDASSIVCLRSLGRRGVHTIAVSERTTPPAFWSRYCDETKVVPSPAENTLGYKNALLSLARRDDVRTIIPVREPDAYVLSKYRSEFEAHVAPLWPAFETLRTVHDRVRLFEAATAAGVPEPNTQLLDEVDDWDRKLIAKARYALLAGEYVDKLSSEQAIEVGRTKYLHPGIEPNREAIRAEMGHSPVVQEYVPGTEYAFRALYDHGEPVATCQKRLLRGYNYARGPSACHEAVRVPRLEEVGLSLLDHLDWHGLASVQFIEDADTGEFKLLEINPRLWASLPCDTLAGVDFPYHYWHVASDDPIRVDPNYEVGLASHLLRGEVAYLLSILREDFAYVERPSFRTALWDVTTSIYEHPHFDSFNLDDPGPFVRYLLNTAPDWRDMSW